MNKDLDIPAFTKKKKSKKKIFLPPVSQIQTQIAWWVNFIKTFSKKQYHSYTDSFRKWTNKDYFPNWFYEANVAVIPKPYTNITRKLQVSVSFKILISKLSAIDSSSIQKRYDDDYTSWSGKVNSRNARLV